MKSLKLIFTAAISLMFTISCGRGGVIQPKPVPTAPVDPIPSIKPDPNGTNPVNDKFIDLKILSFNVWGIPTILGYNPTKDQKERFTNIAGVLDGYDIVNLQETFSDNSNVFLDRANYPTKVRYNNPSFLNINSGLSSLSKYPVKVKKFKKFSECAGTDCHSNKGIFFMRIAVPEIGDVDVYNTHYQAMVDKEQIRMSDNKEFLEFQAQNEAGNLTIMTGDFNFINYDQTDSSSKAYKDFIKKFNPLDTFRIANPGVAGLTNNPSINTYADKREKAQRLDYIFVLPENRGVTTKQVNYKIEVVESKIKFAEPVNGKFLSDHFGLETTLRIHLN